MIEAYFEPATPVRRSRRATGSVLAALTALSASSAGVLLRHVESADAWTVLFTTIDLTISMLLGTVQIGAQFILLTIATRFTGAADVMLVMTLEVILAPLWVWIMIGEVMPVMVLYGGVAVVAAMVMNTAASAAGARGHTEGK